MVIRGSVERPLPERRLLSEPVTSRGIISISAGFGSSSNYLR
jgi:hypothetical protein